MHDIKPRVIGACAIFVGPAELTPAAPHLFALLLAFTLAPREPWTRRGLQELLFGDADERLASHRLRQLLYRLRGMGVVLPESSTGVIRLANPVSDPLDGPDPAAVTTIDRVVPRTDPLGLYQPKLPAPYLDWVEEQRDKLRTALAARRLSALRAARERQDWATGARLAVAIQATGHGSEEVAIVAAESWAMLGHRDDALDAIDQYLRDAGTSLDEQPALRRLRARVAATRIPRREGTLRGREDCLAFLAEQWERAKGSAGGRVTVVFGAPGIGKSRIGEVFGAGIRLGGGQVLYHRCDMHARESPLALFSQLVPELRRRRGSIGADPALAEALDHVAPVAGATPRVSGTAEERRDEVRRAIIDLLDAVSAEQPLLLIVDDAHLLDEASRGVIRALAQSANSAQVLALLLCRPRPDGQTLIASGPRFTSFTLSPLGVDDSRSLLLELSTRRPPTDAELEWAIAQAGGNAFYLHALAHHPSDSVALPAHIKSLAQTSYAGVSPESRTVLDVCLLLDTLATPVRVTRAASMDDRTLLAAVRELEDADLLRYEDGLFVGPHAIIRDALDELMPSTARALLHRRIAELLSAEAADPATARAVGWAAVRSWLACGDAAEALSLALRLARQAALVGEPEAGAMLLDLIPRDVLSVDGQRTLLDLMIELADAGKCMALLTQSLRERKALAERQQEGRSVVAKYANLLSAAEHSSGKTLDVDASQRIADDTTLISSVRADAITRILADAFMRFDAAKAQAAYEQLVELPLSRDSRLPVLRGEIVYHTTFGSTEIAYDLVSQLIAETPPLSLDSHVRICYSYAVFSLLRLGCYERCIGIAEDAWKYMDEQNHLTSSEYFGALAAEAHINLGSFDDAERIFRQLRHKERLRGATEVTPISGLLSVDVLLGIASGDHERAQRAMTEVSRLERAFSLPRHRQLILAHQTRIAQMRGDHDSGSQWLEELSLLFAHARTMGDQDSVAEALWHARRIAGDSQGAFELLSNYLAVRREIGPPEALLRMSTAADPAWNRAPAN